MRWVKLYCDFHEHRKVIELDPTAGFLWVLCLSYAGCQETDGFIPRGIARRFIGGELGEEAAERLVKAGLWEVVDGGYQMHDWQERQETSEAIAQRREATRERVADWRNSRRNAVTNGVSNGPVLSKSESSSTSKVVGESLAAPARAREESAELGQKVRQVFDAYCASTGRTGRYVLDGKRQRVIRSALSVYPLDDVLDAVDGWRFVPHNRGENATGALWNDIGLLLRDAEHIERFRDAKRRSEASPVVGGLKPATAAWVERMERELMEAKG